LFDNVRFISTFTITSDNAHEYKRKIVKMGRLGLTQEAIEAIKQNPILFGQVATAIGVSTLTLPAVLKRNDVKLTGIAVINILRKHMGVSKNMDLVEEIEKTNEAA
jgi:hypothetical protein